jgi:hypothetical protein
LKKTVSLLLEDAAQAKIEIRLRRIGLLLRGGVRGVSLAVMVDLYLEASIDHGDLMPGTCFVSLRIQ